jgi:hypothetical protein
MFVAGGRICLAVGMLAACMPLALSYFKQVAGPENGFKY